MVIVLVLVAGMPAAKPCLNINIPSRLPITDDLFEGKSVEQQKKDWKRFKEFQLWNLLVRQNERLSELKNFIKNAYDEAIKLDPYDASQNQNSLLLNFIVESIARAQEVAKEDILKEYWKTDRGKNNLKEFQFRLDLTNDLIAVFITGAIEIYPQEVWNELDKTWKSIDFMLMPLEKEKKLETIYED